MNKIFDVCGFPVILHLPCILLAAKANERETPLSLFGCRLLKVEIWWAAVTYSPQDSASTTSIVEAAIAICLKSLKTKGGSAHHTGWSFYGMRMWNHLVMFCYPLLHFSKTHELWSSKATFTIAFFSAVNHNYDHKQQTLKHRNTQNESKSTNHKLWPFEPIGVNFCFLRGLLRRLMAAKNACVSCLLDFRICVFLKSSVSLDRIQRCNSTLFECFLAVLSCLFNYSTKDAFFLNSYRNLLLFK